MADNQSFIVATNFLKDEFGFGSAEIASRLGVEKHVIDNARRGSRKADKVLIRGLIREFPDVSQFFATDDAIKKGEDVVQEPFVFYQDGETLKELVKTQQETIAMQRKLIEMIEKENLLLKGENLQLKAESKTLREIISDRTKKPPG